MENYTFKQVETKVEKNKIISERLENKLGWEKNSAEDYKGVEGQIENKKYGLKNQKTLIKFAEKKAEKLFPNMNVNKYKSVGKYFYFPVIEHYFQNAPIIDPELVRDLRSGAKLLSIGVGAANLEKLLYEGFDLPKDAVVISDIKLDPHAMNSGLNTMQFDMTKKWPEFKERFTYILFPESFGVANFVSAQEKYSQERETPRFYEDVNRVVDFVISDRTGELAKNEKEFFIKLMKMDVPIVEKKVYTIIEAIHALQESGELRFSGHLMNDQELVYTILRLEDEFRGKVKVIKEPYLRIIKQENQNKTR